MLDYDRDELEWDLKYSTTGKTHKIYIWKSTASAVYFHIVTDETTPKHIYLKYSTTANRDLMREVQVDGCAKGDYTSSVNSSSVTMKKDDKTFLVHNTDYKYKFFRTWAFSAAEPGFFGFMEYTLKKQFYDNDGEAVSSPASVTDTYTVTTSSTTSEQSSDDYESVDYPNRFYCLVNDYTTTHIDVMEVSIADTDSNLKCISDDSLTVTVGTETFDPDAELVAPF